MCRSAPLSVLLHASRVPASDWLARLVRAICRSRHRRFARVFCVCGCARHANTAPDQTHTVCVQTHAYRNGVGVGAHRDKLLNWCNRILTRIEPVFGCKPFFQIARFKISAVRRPCLFSVYGVHTSLTVAAQHAFTILIDRLHTSLKRAIRNKRVSFEHTCFC